MLYYWHHRQEWPDSLNNMYQVAQISKQGFHKKLYRHKRHTEETANLIEIIRQIRSDHPTMCCRSMYYKIHPMYMGRDRFEALCRAHGFMSQPRKTGRRTTDSSGVIRFDNLIKDLKLTRIDQVWSSDITYFELDNCYYYITFIIDDFSRRILGHHVSSRLLTEQTSLPALKRALATRSGSIPPGVIFHSDGGGQYYDDNFLALTRKYHMKNSMCEYAYENGKAERINGIIKNNYLKHWNIKNLAQLIKSVDRAVYLYNQDKPHTSLDRLTPIQFENKLAILEQQNRPSEKNMDGTNLQTVKGLRQHSSYLNTRIRADKMVVKKNEFNLE